MKRNEVIKLFRITKLDNKTIDNILEMNALSLDSSGNYDTKKCCRVFANAGKLYHTYIPDYIAANLLNTSIDDLINMNLEFVIAPVKYQGIFYDEYGKENLTFQYSKYLFNIIPILTMASFYARELYLEIIPDIFELYPDRFLTLEDTVRALYMSHINSYLYHYYLMRMKIRFAYVKGVRRYFLDDIENVLEMAQDFFESNISDIELSQHYSYACYCFMVKYLEKDGGIYTVFPDYDVVLSDKRFPNGFQESTRYYSKKKVNHAYYWWFIHYNCMICNVNPPLSRKYNLYVEVSINNTQGYYYDPVYGITVRKLHNISETYDNNQILGVLEIEDADELLYEPYSNSRSKYIYYIYGFSKINSDVFDIEICKLLHRRFTYISNLSSITELISSLFSTYLFETAFNNYKEGDINDFESYHIFKNSHVLISGIPQSHTETTPWTYAWCNVILNKSPFLDYVEGYNRNITYIELRKIYSMKYYNLKDLDTHQAYFYDSRIIDHIKGKSFLYDYKAQVSKITKLLPLEKSENYKYITSAPSEYRIVNHISNNKDYFTLKETITFLNIKEYSFKLIWYILCNCGLSITFFDLMIYFNKKEILSLYDQLKKITDEYTSFDHINYISHGKPYFIRCNYSVLIIDMCYAYLLSLEHPCYVFLSGISDNYIDHINNYPYHCKLFLTNAEVNRNLKLLPAKIPGTLVNRLLNVNKDTKYYKTNEWKYFNKNNVFRMREQLNELVELYVPEDKIPEYVDKNISCLTKADLKILESIPSINIPEFAISSCDWFEGSSTSNRAYTKEDIHYIQYYLHEEFNYLINYSKLLVANDIYNVNTYQTYKLRLDLFVSKYNLDSECETYNLWNGYIKLKLDMNRASERTVNTKINQYIKAYYTLDYMLKKLNIKSVYLINTSFINRIFDNNIPITYSKILLGFFRYVSSVYKSRLIKVSFNVREIKIPENHKLPFIDMISQTYSFDEYSIIFDYCNNYSIHIKKSLDEITNTGTCTYASTWFYIMCHLNNAWRSADFTYFPNINIKKIIDRNISDKGYSWFLDSNLSNSDSKIIILDLQSNPKVVSKTKKIPYLCVLMNYLQLLQRFIYYYHTILAFYRLIPNLFATSIIIIMDLVEGILIIFSGILRFQSLSLNQER
ncbi:hypothetical protein lbkm_1100 [Lachnospiraceae bacterium KM106-2]|nr:hypothetical protein lbkm_1100 [Lachnospiraceae bacterium KM106-2]